MAQTSWLCTGYRSPEPVATEAAATAIAPATVRVSTWMLSLLPVSHQRSREAVGKGMHCDHPAGQKYCWKPVRAVWVEPGVDPEERQGSQEGYV